MKLPGTMLVTKRLLMNRTMLFFDAMGVPHTTDGKFKKDSEAPFSSDGMVTFGQAIREGKMSLKTGDFEKLTGDQPLIVKYMFEHSDDFQIGARHSQDK